MKIVATLPHTLHWDTEKQGTMTEATARTWLTSQGYRVSLYHYSPGTYFPPHTHDVEKINLVLKGMFQMSAADSLVVLQAGDAIFVPSGAVHDARVLGEETVICLDAVR